MNIAIIGCGRMGNHVLQAVLAHSQVATVWCCDPSISALASIEGSPKIRKSVDLNPALDDPNVALVFITTPNHTHKELALAAMRKGKAVMLEKPIATTLEDSRQVVEESERLGTFLQIGFELRYSTLYTTVKHWIDEGLLGELTQTQCTYICSEFHGKGSWRNLLSTGGSMFGEKLSHYVDLPRWWSGSEVEEVYTLCAPNIVPYFEVRDNYNCSYRHKSGLISHLSFMMAVASTFDGDPLQNPVTQQIDDGHELRFLVVGTKGAAETDVFRRRLRRWSFTDGEKALTSRLIESQTWNEDQDHAYFHNTTEQARDVIRRVAQRCGPYTSPRDSLRTMALVEAAEASAELRRPIRLEN